MNGFVRSVVLLCRIVAATGFLFTWCTVVFAVWLAVVLRVATVFTIDVTFSAIWGGAVSDEKLRTILEFWPKGFENVVWILFPSNEPTSSTQPVLRLSWKESLAETCLALPLLSLPVAIPEVFDLMYRYDPYQPYHEYGFSIGRDTSTAKNWQKRLADTGVEYLEYDFFGALPKPEKTDYGITDVVQVRIGAIQARFMTDDAKGYFLDHPPQCEKKFSPFEFVPLSRLINENLSVYALEVTEDKMRGLYMCGDDQHCVEATEFLKRVVYQERCNMG